MEDVKENIPAIPQNQKGLQYSLSSLFKAPYNKGKISFALYRFSVWMYVQLFKRVNYKFNIWKNRKIFLNYHSLQCMWLMHNYWVDWEEYNLIKDILDKNSTAFDVGANIGLYSLWMSKYNQNGVVHSFEPDDKNYAFLEKNIRLNHLEGRIYLNKTGIADKTGYLYLTKNIDVENHLTTEKTSDAVEIPIITLDDYCRQNSAGKIRYLKIDIEGFELSALLGAKNLLTQGAIDIIQLEINNALSNSGASQGELISFLNSYGYHLARYNVEEKTLENINYSKERENYFAVRSVDELNRQIRKKVNEFNLN
jgi:FkbM family methyltransferase